MPATRKNRPVFKNWFNAGNNTELRLERVNGAWEWVIRPIWNRTQLVLRALQKLLRKAFYRLRVPHVNLVDYNTIAPDYYSRRPNRGAFGPTGTPFETREDVWRTRPGQEWWHVTDAQGFNDIVDLATRDNQYMHGQGYR
jgi:hypothetical protein